jgi:hypothetical protein
LWFVNRRDLCAEMICNLEKGVQWSQWPTSQGCV